MTREWFMTFYVGVMWEPITTSNILTHLFSQNWGFCSSWPNVTSEFQLGRCTRPQEDHLSLNFGNHHASLIRHFPLVYIIESYWTYIHYHTLSAFPSPQKNFENQLEHISRSQISLWNPDFFKKAPFFGSDVFFLLPPIWPTNLKPPGRIGISSQGSPNPAANSKTSARAARGHGCHELSQEPHWKGQYFF